MSRIASEENAYIGSLRSRNDSEIWFRGQGGTRPIIAPNTEGARARDYLAQMAFGEVTSKIDRHDLFNATRISIAVVYGALSATFLYE